MRSKRFSILNKALAFMIAFSLVFAGTPFKLGIKSASAAGKKTILILGFEPLGSSDDYKEKQTQTLKAMQAQLTMSFDDFKGLNIVQAKDMAKKFAAPKEEGSDIAPSAGTKGSEKDLKKAKRFIDDGLDAIDNKEYADAAANFDKAEKLIKKAPDLINAKFMKNLVKMYEQWAFAAYKSGGDEEGAAALKKLLALSPNAELEDDGAPASMKKEFKALKKGKGKSTLKITAYRKKRAAILINGEQQKDNPATLKNVYPGVYFVEISAPGMETYTEAVEVPESGADVKVRLGGGDEKAEGGSKGAKVSVEDLTAKLTKGELDKDFLKGMNELAEAGSVDFAAFGLFYAEGKTEIGFQGFLYAKSAQAVVKLEPITADKNNFVDGAEKALNQYEKYFNKFPKGDSAAVWKPGVFAAPGGGKTVEKVAVKETSEVESITGKADKEEKAEKKSKKGKNGKKQVEDEETVAPVKKDEEKEVKEEKEDVAPVVVKEEVQEEPKSETKPKEKVVEKEDLDTDVSFLVDKSDKIKAQEDMSESKEKSFGQEEEPPFYTKWWFWTAIGVVVVAGGVTAGVLLAPSGPDNTSTVTMPR